MEVSKRLLIEKLKLLVANRTPKAFMRGLEDHTIIWPERVVYIKDLREGVLFVQEDGSHEICTEPIGTIKKRFLDCLNFVSGDEFSLVNLDYLSRSTYESGEYRVWFSEGFPFARVTPANTKEFTQGLSIPSLRWCKGYQRMMTVCQRANIRLFKEDLRTFSKDRLLAEFGIGSQLVMTALLYNLIWQVYTRLVNGELSEDEQLMGNIRSFWYTYLKPILAVLDHVDDRHYDDMIEAFTRFTVDWKLFKYKDWDFLDTNKHNKNIGQGKRMYLFLVAEKEGWLRILEFVHQKYKITTIALGGEASVLSIEYFIDDLEDAGLDKAKDIHVFFITDYDPAGVNIQETFLHKIKRHYVRRLIPHSLITLDRFTPQEVDLNKFQLILPDNEHSQTWLTRVKKWVKQTGGIGQPGTTWKKRAYGMEADAIAPGRLIKIFEEAAKPYL
jgi:hypothetical protein